MSINLNDFSTEVVRKPLMQVGLYTVADEQLIVRTAAVESRLGEFLIQKGGPALGPFQMEPETHQDIYQNFLNYKPDLRSVILSACGYYDNPPADAMITNLKYAAIMCRIHYLRRQLSKTNPRPTPRAGDVTAQGEYWKQYYNSALGAGSVEKFISASNKIIGDYYD